MMVSPVAGMKVLSMDSTRTSQFSTPRNENDQVLPFFRGNWNRGWGSPFSYTEKLVFSTLPSRGS